MEYVYVERSVEKGELPKESGLYAVIEKDGYASAFTYTKKYGWVDDDGQSRADFKFWLERVPLSTLIKEKYSEKWKELNEKMDNALNDESYWEKKKEDLLASTSAPIEPSCDAPLKS